MSQRTKKPTIRLVRPVKTQISLRIRAVWSESSLVACPFYSIQAIQKGINENPCHTGWMYRLTWVFACHKGLIVGFVVRSLKWLRPTCKIEQPTRDKGVKILKEVRPIVHVDAF